MAYKYDPEDKNFRPVTILQTLNQEHPKPSYFKAAFQGLLSNIRFEEERLKQQYYEIARVTYNLPSIDEVKIKAREIYKRKLFSDRQAEIDRMNKAVVHYTMASKRKEFFQNSHPEQPTLEIESQDEEYSHTWHTNVIRGVRHFSPKEIENAQARLPDDIQKQVDNASDLELLNALRPQDVSDFEKLTKEEIELEQTWEQWLKVFGDGNMIEFEMKNRYPEVLQIKQENIGEDSQAASESEIKVIDKNKPNIPTRLTLSDLTFISAWKAAQNDTREMSFQDFCNQYVALNGHSIDPIELEDAWEGRNIIQGKKSGKQVYEYLKRRSGIENVRGMLESRSKIENKRERMFSIIDEIGFTAPSMPRSEIVKELMSRMKVKYPSANRYLNMYKKLKK